MTFPGETIPIVAEVTRAAREAARMDTTRPVVVGYHPVARLNPFQELLYSGAEESGATVVPIIYPENLQSLETAIRMGIPTVLHLHWTEAALKDAIDEGDAHRRGREFSKEMQRLQSLGIRIVWTVHNVLPHLCEYPTAEANLRAELAAYADAIHVMNPDTVDEVSSYYELPAEKVFIVPHPSYEGFYPDVARSTARFALGMSPDDVVVGAIGSIQRYKGLTMLAGALDAASRDRTDVRGFIAGIPGRDSEDLIRELTGSPSVRILAKRLSDREIAQAMAAIDFMALPYTRTLNSGAAALAATFNVPIIAPNVTAFTPMLDAGLGIGFAPDDRDDFERAVSDAVTDRLTVDPEAAEAYRSSIHPQQVSASFFGEVIDRVYRD